MRLLPSLAVILLLAGCLTGPGPSGPAQGPDEVPVDWAERALPSQSEKHDHRDWTHHLNLSTPNFVQLAHDPLAIPGFGDRTAGGYFCGGSATTKEGRKLTIISSFDTALAFSVVDVTDPARPTHLGDYFLDRAQTYDADITPDGKHVVVAADISTGEPNGPAAAGGLVTLRASFRDACTGEVVVGPDRTVAAGPSTILVSIADPKNPTFEDLVTSPVIGPHSVSTAEIDGQLYVASSITNLVHAASYFQFFRIDATPLGHRLVPLSVVDAAQYGQTAATNGHVDAEIALHPVTKKPVVYLSNWDGGLVILDFSVPQAPRLLGTWADTGRDGGNVHSTRPLEGVRNGKHYVLVGQEFINHPSGRPSGWVYIIDDTDPSNPREVGRWTLPVDVQARWNNVELFSTHYFRVHNDTVFVAMYHGGMWAFKLDFGNESVLRQPPSVGVFMPDKGPKNGREPDGTYDLAPFVLDVFPQGDGHVIVYDGLSGVYSVRFDETVRVPSPQPWPIG